MPQGFDDCKKNAVNKKIVRYSALHSPVNEGERVFLVPVDHPDKELVTNGKEVITSPVETVGYDGLFTTRNTIYVPEGYAGQEARYRD